jgi:hypothetical protein
MSSIIFRRLLTTCSNVRGYGAGYQHGAVGVKYTGRWRGSSHLLNGHGIEIDREAHLDDEDGALDTCVLHLEAGQRRE